MKGVLRTVALCYSWVPLQLWMLMTGAVMIVAGHVGALMLGRESLLAPLIVTLGLTLIALPLFVVTGMMWRSVSAPRALEFLPRARLKLLLGVMGATLILALMVSANMALLQLERPATQVFHSGLASLGVDIWLVGMGLTVAGFLFNGSPLAVVSTVLVIAIAPNVLSRLPAVSELTAGIGVTPLLAATTVCFCGAFAAWYLRARRIAPPGWRGEWRLNSASIRKIDASRKAAITVYLLGLTSVTQLLQRGSLIAAVLAVGGLFLQRVAAHPNGARDLQGPVLILLSALPLALASVLARRSKTLWLKAGCSREQLFLLCERTSWLCSGALGAPVLALFVVARFLLPHPAGNWSYLLVVTLATAICGLYLGLIRTGASQLRDVIVAILIAIVGLGNIAVSTKQSSTTVTPTMLSILVAELLIALALRWLAQRRWQRIDWLLYRPPRPSQAPRPVR